MAHRFELRPIDLIPFMNQIFKREFLVSGKLFLELAHEVDQFFIKNYKGYLEIRIELDKQEQKCFLLWSSKGCFLFIQQKQPPEYSLSILLFFPTFTTQCRYEIEHNGLVDKISVLWHPSSFQIWTFNVITDFLWYKNSARVQF